MATIDLYSKVKKILDVFGCNNRVYTVPEGSVPCPCTDNPYHQYSSVWHLQHPEAPDCHQTGKLTAEQAEGYFEVQTIWGICIPAYSMSGEDALRTLVAMNADWNWLGVTQEDAQFNRWVNPRGQVFAVRSEMPYYISPNGDELAVALYGLTPITRTARIP